MVTPGVTKPKSETTDKLGAKSKGTSPAQQDSLEEEVGRVTRLLQSSSRGCSVGMKIGQDKSAVTACIGELSADLERLNSKLDIGNFETASRPMSKSSVTINFLSDFFLG